jgi:hypothetical protein
MLFIVPPLLNASEREETRESTVKKSIKLAIAQEKYRGKSTYHRISARIMIIAPTALLLVLVDPIAPIIVMTKSANQKIVSMIFRTTLTFVFAHRFSFSTCAVETWYAMKTADLSVYKETTN